MLVTNWGRASQSICPTPIRSEYTLAIKCNTSVGTYLEKHMVFDLVSAFSSKAIGRDFLQKGENE